MVQVPTQPELCFLLGTTSQAAEKLIRTAILEGFVSGHDRGTLGVACRKRNRINEGWKGWVSTHPFIPCGMPFRHFVRNRAFSHSLSSLCRPNSMLRTFGREHGAPKELPRGDVQCRHTCNGCLVLRCISVKDNRFPKAVSSTQNQCWRRIIDLRTYTCKRNIRLQLKKSFVFV